MKIQFNLNDVHGTQSLNHVLVLDTDEESLSLGGNIMLHAGKVLDFLFKLAESVKADENKGIIKHDADDDILAILVATISHNNDKVVLVNTFISKLKEIGEII